MRIAAVISWCITIVFLSSGFLFKMMHWPGASIFLVYGFSISLPAMLIHFILRYQKKSEAKITTYAVYFYVMVLVIGLTVLEGIKASRYLLNDFIIVQQHTDKSSRYLQNLISQEKYQSNKDLINKTMQVVEILRNDRYNLIISAGGVDQDSIPLGKDNMDIAITYFVVMDEGAKGDHLVNEIAQLRNEFLNEFTQLSLNPNLLYEDVSQPRFSNEGFPQNWISYNFEHSTLAASLTKMSTLENQILHTLLIVLEEKNKRRAG
jgi:hypothetical protein